MAKIKTKTKSKTSIFLCCFGSHLPKEVKECDDDDDVIPKKKRSRWFSWLRNIGMNRKSTSKTVPFEASFSNVNSKSSKRSKSSSSTLHKSKTQLTNPSSLPPTQPPLVLPGTPYYTPSQTRHGPNNNKAEDTREKLRSTPATRTKRQDRRLSSTMQKNQTTSKTKNVRGSYDAVVGMSVLLVTLIILIFWGRLCAILCTSSWLYFIPRFRKITIVNDENDDDPKVKLNDVDLDSEEYKKKVIMEGLLWRNHRS